jgi:galactose-1-phosphate uridylyltransferase
MNTPNIEVICSNKGFDVEISSLNKPPRELYRIISSESNDETWLWPLPAETRSFLI